MCEHCEGWPAPTPLIFPPLTNSVAALVDLSAREHARARTLARSLARSLARTHARSHAHTQIANNFSLLRPPTVIFGPKKRFNIRAVSFRIFAVAKDAFETAGRPAPLVRLVSHPS